MTELLEISTGSSDFDRLVGRGIAEGFLYDIYGEAGSGKSQLCFSICANCAQAGEHVFFIDTSGTFRPERIVQVAGKESVLGKIKYHRVLSTADQYSAMERARQISPRIIIVDSATNLFSVEFNGYVRHLKAARLLHALALTAVSGKCSVIATSPIRSVIQNTPNIVVPTGISSELIQREFLDKTVSPYAHMRIGLKTLDPSTGRREARITHPVRGHCIFAVSSRGVINFQN